jgi:hypothetical protein
MNARLRLLLACSAAFLGTAAHAQEHIKPGLWESSRPSSAPRWPR